MRHEVVDYQTYNDRRDLHRAGILKQKERRRIQLGDYLTFLFENHDTIHYQVQEMMRTEHIVREADIQHEIDTFNELLGGPGALGCTLLIGIDDPAQRATLLRQWLDLPHHLYVTTGDGRRIAAAFDARQVGEDRLSAVQYLTFDTAGRTPVAIGSDLPALTCEVSLPADQRQALAEDLAAPEG